LDQPNIFSVISVNHHLAGVLPFPYFGQTLPELLRNCLRAVFVTAPQPERPNCAEGGKQRNKSPIYFHAVW